MKTHLQSPKRTNFQCFRAFTVCSPNSFKFSRFRTYMYMNKKYLPSTFKSCIIKKKDKYAYIYLIRFYWKLHILLHKKCLFSIESCTWNVYYIVPIVQVEFKWSSEFKHIVMHSFYLSGNALCANEKVYENRNVVHTMLTI